MEGPSAVRRTGVSPFWVYACEVSAISRVKGVGVDEEVKAAKWMEK